MSNFMIALLMGAGVGVWIYTKVMKRTGGNATQSAATGAVVAVIAMMIVITVLSLAD